MNYQIKSNLPVSGSHWGLIFRDGVAVTEDKRLAERLKERGYEVLETVNDDLPVAAAEKSEAADVAPASEPVTDEPEPEKFTCTKCGKQYQSASALKRHFDKCEA